MNIEYMNIQNKRGKNKIDLNSNIYSIRYCQFVIYFYIDYNII